MIEIHRETPYNIVYLDGEEIVIYYDKLNPKNKGDASISFGLDGAVLFYDGNEIPVICEFSYENDFETNIYRCSTIKNDQKGINEKKDL